MYKIFYCKNCLDDITVYMAVTGLVSTHFLMLGMFPTLSTRLASLGKLLRTLLSGRLWWSIHVRKPAFRCGLLGVRVRRGWLPRCLHSDILLHQLAQQPHVIEEYSLDIDISINLDKLGYPGVYTQTSYFI